MRREDDFSDDGRNTGVARIVRAGMFYLIPAATLLMLGYVFWRAAFQMRRDRLSLTREQTRGKFAFRPKDRLRFLLGRSFAVPEEKPEWEEPLVARLAEEPLPGSAESEAQSRVSPREPV
jgi:hypothetical protein